MADSGTETEPPATGFWEAVRRPCFSEETTEKILAKLNGNAAQIIITIMIFFALFGDDFRLAACPKSADDVFQVITILCLVVFAVELLVNYVCMPNWRLGTYMFMEGRDRWHTPACVLADAGLFGFGSLVVAYALYTSRPSFSPPQAFTFGWISSRQSR
jgi:hypothetical protein